MKEYFLNTDKISIVRKYYKRNINFLEITINNFASYNIYIRLDYFKDLKSYKLMWFDLDRFDKDIEKIANYQYISENVIEKIKEDCSKINTKSIEYYNSNSDFITDRPIIEVYINSKTQDTKDFHTFFIEFVPPKMQFLVDLFIFVFNNLPKKLEDFLPHLLAEYTDNKMRYSYKDEFNFDLYNGNLIEIFDPAIIERGEKYYSDNKVIYVEKIDDRYFAVVRGTQDYVVAINYNDNEKRMQVYCSCPCEFYCKHIYAVILSIRDNINKRFYKISYRKKNADLIEIITNFDYYLCVGLIEDNFEIINKDGEIELVPILSKDNKCYWQIIEDDENQTLKKDVESFIRD